MSAERSVVFVVDDDTSMRGALENLIGSVGLEVRAFASPQDFLRAERPDAPACLVLDVRLPGKSGLAFHEELVKAGIALPVIFITGHGDIPMSVRAMKAGAVEFLPSLPRPGNAGCDPRGARARPRARRDADFVGELEARYAA